MCLEHLLLPASCLHHYALLLQVVVDFYNAACGACKYILPQFVKMCKSGGQGAGGMGGVVFVKHDVRDEYDELTVRPATDEKTFLTG